MPKRIPSQSAFPGVSTKQWVRFVNSLTEEEAYFLRHTCCYYCISEQSPCDCSCSDDLAGIMEKVFLHLPGKSGKFIPQAFPPSPPLVGIELNPGPDMNQLVVASRGKKKARSKNTQVVISSSSRSQPQALRRRPRTNSAIPRMVNNSSSQFLKAYTDSIQDPWEYGPIDLGYGTLIETVKGTTYLRNNFTVNADGSFGIALLPQCVNMVITNTAGAAVATWTNNAATNVAAIGSQMNAGRVCSGGVRIFTLFPETSSSGVLFAGSIPGSSITNFSSFSPTTLSGLATSELGIGKRGARSVILPIDMSSFNMNFNTINTWPSGSLIPSTIPYISGLGFPAGTVVWYEAVLNVEGVPVVTSASIGLDADRKTVTASDFFATPERLMRAASGLLTQTVVMDAVQGLASMASPSLGRAIGSARSVFGSGRNVNRALVAGRNSNNQSRQNTVVIEEMKEEESGGRRGWLSI